MKKQMLQKFMVRVLPFALPAFLLFSCDNKPNPSEGTFGEGIYVVNEGGFTQSNGSISFIDRATGTGYVNLFVNANGGMILGDVVQCMVFNGSDAFIVANNSNKIVRVNATDFTFKSQIGGLQLPRYMVMQGNNIAFVTEWQSFGVPGQVSKIDLSTNTVLDTVTVGQLPEKMVLQGSRLFVVNSAESTVSVIDITLDSVIATLNVGDAPNSIIEDGSGMLWVLCGGFPAFTGNETAGALVRVNPVDLLVEETLPFSSITFHPSNLCLYNNTLFYHTGKDVYRFIIGTALDNTSIIHNDVIYGLGIDPNNGDILVADPGDFDGAGKALRFSSSFIQLDSAMTGIAPNGFLFK